MQVPGDIDARLDDLAHANPDSAAIRDERLPYWADLWPSSIALAEELLRTPPFCPDDQILEIGCGLGLASIAAGLRGGRVIMTDYLPEAGRAARRNWAANIDTPPEVRQMDWRAPEPGLRADLILAADVAYEKRSFQPLIKAFKTLLLPDGKILLAEPRRWMFRPFIDSLDEQGFHRETKTRKTTIGNRVVLVDIHALAIRCPPPPITRGQQSAGK